jgi:hypothetical protein
MNEHKISGALGSQIRLDEMGHGNVNLIKRQGPNRVRRSIPYPFRWPLHELKVLSHAVLCPLNVFISLSISWFWTKTHSCIRCRDHL